MATSSPAHPIQVVVTDDLERRRVTVLLRLLLAIPHLLFVLVWGVAAFVLAFVVWLAILVEGRAPRTLQAFTVSYLRYAVHVGAYVHLAASPFPGFTGQPGYPVDIEVQPAARQSRRGAAVRLLLALPALFLAGVLGGMPLTGGSSYSARADSSGWTWSTSGSLGVAATAALLAWFACLARGRMPQGLRDLIAYCVGYGAQATGYLLFVTDRYPNSDPALVRPPQDLPNHPVGIDVRDGLGRSRLMVFFRLLLAVPHLVWLGLWSVPVVLATLVAWVAALATGRVPSALHRFIAAWTRYGAHVFSFLYLVGGPFPGFVGAQGSYPVDLLVEAPARQHRARTLFRLPLALPALLLAGALAGVLGIVAVLGWWAALITGRMPAGLRNLGAGCVRYAVQTAAYALLLTDRYPYASPALRDRPRHEQLSLDLGQGAPAAEIEPT